MGDLAPRAPLYAVRIHTDWRIGFTQNLLQSTLAPAIQPAGEQYTERLETGPIQPLRSWTWNYNLNLIGQDKLPFRQQDWPLTPDIREPRTWLAGFRPDRIKPFNQQDWPVPIAPQQPALSWTASYNLNLIGQDRLPFRQQDWPLTPDVREPRTWLQGFRADRIKPFNQQDWPVPIAPQQPAYSWTASYNLNLIGKDQLPFRQQDWPLTPDIREARTWIQGFNIQAQVTAAPFNQLDWPNPTAPQQPLYGMTASFNLNLIGQDKLPFRQTDWPITPDIREPRTWLQGFSTNRLKPFNQQDWPVPIAPQQPAYGMTASYNPNLIGQDVLPFRQQDWPLTPDIRDPRTWLAGYSQFRFPVTPFKQTDWPLTPDVREARTWLQGFRPDRIKPFNQQDWPVPIAPQQPAYGFTASFNLNLIGQDQLPNRQMDWPLTPDIRSVRIEPITGFALYRVGAVPVGVQVFDLPPRDVQRGPPSLTASFNLNLIGQDQLPFRQMDWPLPQAPRYGGPPATTWSSYPLYPPPIPPAFTTIYNKFFMAVPGGMAQIPGDPPS